MTASRLSRTFSISLPPELAEEIDRVAESERRSRSELLREAFRLYVERWRRWNRIFAYGEQAARTAGVRDEAEVTHVLAAGLKGAAVIVTGDSDLLTLECIGSVRIVDPARFAARPAWQATEAGGRG